MSRSFTAKTAYLRDEYACMLHVGVEDSKLRRAAVFTERLPMISESRSK